MDFVLLLGGHVLNDWTHPDHVEILIPKADPHEYLIGAEGGQNGLEPYPITSDFTLHGCISDMRAIPEKSGHFWIKPSKATLNSGTGLHAKGVTFPRPHHIDVLLGRLSAKEVNGKPFLGNTPADWISSPVYGDGQYLLCEVSAWVYEQVQGRPYFLMDGKKYEAQNIGGTYFLAIRTAEIQRVGEEAKPGMHTGNTVNNLLGTSIELTNDDFTALTVQQSKEPFRTWLRLIQGVGGIHILGGVEAGSCDQGDYGP
jgi:hypothetical protein